MTKTNLEKLKEVTAIQCNDGNWDYDHYMRGMANGLILAVSCFSDDEPEFKDEPKDGYLRFAPSDGGHVLTCAEAEAEDEA